jgi:RHS repeat-associated protein
MQTTSQVRVLMPGGSNQWLTTTIYYDDRGRAIQSKSENLRHGIDRLTSQYDFEGKVVTTYQHQTVVDAIPTSAGNVTHSIRYRYLYDGGGRPVSLFGLFDGVNGNTQEVLLSVSEYNELGQLADSKLGRFAPRSRLYGAKYLQSVDYRYNLRGQLEKINNRNISGVSRTADGSWQLQNSAEWLGPHTPNEDLDAYADLFGLELEYDASHTGSPTVNYNGNITSAMWRSRSNNQLRGFGYEYNQLNQLTAARYGAYHNQATGRSDWSGEKDDQNGKGRYTTDGLAFDLNGNITALNRAGRQSSSTTSAVYGAIDQLAYSYDGNKLTAVTDGAGTSEAPNDFEDPTQQSEEYVYDANGNVTEDKNKGITISYNELGLPNQIRFANGNPLTFIYSATGEKLCQYLISSDGAGGLSWKQVDYIAGFVYGQGSHLFVATATGRAIFEPNRTQEDKWVQEYHLRDHLGSLRLAFRGGGTDLLASASMEPSVSVREENQFDHLAETRKYDPAHARTGDYSALLKAGQHGQGPTAMLPVKAGDSLRIEVFGRYDALKPSAAPVLLPALGASSNAPGPRQTETPAATRPGRVPRLLAGLTVAWTGLLPALFHSPKNDLPQAYVRYDLYDKDSVFVKSEVKLLDATARNDWQELALEVTPAQDGYVRVFLENNSALTAWFDDLSIVAAQELIVQENHYDPFGQNLVDIETVGKPDCKNQYTGKERLSDKGLEWTDYGARMYDAQLGRWHSPDPATQYASPFTAMGNNPVSYVDADGRFAFIPVLIGAAIGAFQGYSYANSSGASGWAKIGYTLAGAAVGGFSGGASAQIMAGGGVAAGTGSILFGSAANSIGMNIVTQGNYSNRIALGAASIDMATGDIGYLGEKGNSLTENIGYGIGAFSNASDVYAAAMGAVGERATDVDLITKNRPVGHSALMKGEHQLISFGPKDGQFSIFGGVPNDVEWPNYLDHVGFKELTSKINISNVRLDRIIGFSTGKLYASNYALFPHLGYSCVTASSTALLKAGVLNLPILRHPALLQTQMFLRQNPYLGNYLTQ